MDKYRLYIDESGTASFKNMNGNNKYLTLSVKKHHIAQRRYL